MSNAPLLRSSLALAVLAASITACHPSGPAGRSPVDDGATLVSVSATAEARHAPDIAVLSTGVVTQAADARTAIELNSRRMATVIEAIAKAGVDKKDVQTSGVSLNPDYAYAPNRPPRIKGYFASNTVNVTVRDIARLGDILDALVGVGANQVNGPMFDIADKDAVLDEARSKALAKARARAELYAKRLGLRVARIVSVDETGRGGARPVYARGAAVQASAAAALDVQAAAPIAPGENTLQLTLDVVYALQK